MKKITLSFLFIALLSLLAWQVAAKRDATKDDRGYVLERDAEVAQSGPGPHQGGGQSIGYSFFQKVAGFKFEFRKRVLKPGAAIGYHLQSIDEIYYILSGSGVMQMNGKEFPVKPGDAILTRPGSSHGLKQTGSADLTLMIAYEKHGKN
jgi:mannose-6-phosphate isomerase-like protein (cupin superfamily)